MEPGGMYLFKSAILLLILTAFIFILWIILLRIRNNLCRTWAKKRLPSRSLIISLLDIGNSPDLESTVYSCLAALFGCKKKLTRPGELSIILFTSKEIVLSQIHSVLSVFLIETSYK